MSEFGLQVKPVNRFGLPCHKGYCSLQEPYTSSFSIACSTVDIFITKNIQYKVIIRTKCISEGGLL